MADENKIGFFNKKDLLCAQLNIDKNYIDFLNPTFLFKANTVYLHLRNHQLNLISMKKNLNSMPLLITTQNHPTS